MPLKFKCLNCGSDITIRFLEPGENALCKNCGNYNVVPEPGTPGVEVFQGEGPREPEFLAIRADSNIVENPLGLRDISDNIGEIFKVYFRNFLSIVILYGISYLPYLGLAYLFERIPENPDAINFGHIFSIFMGLGLALFYNLIVTPIISLAVFYIICNYYLEEKIGIIPAMQKTIGKAITGVAAYLLVGVAVVLAFITIIGIPVAFYIAVSWSLIIQVIILENLGVIDAIKRSYDLVKGFWWHYFGTSILLGLILIFPAIGNGLLPWYLNVVGTVILYGFWLVLPSILYFDLRARKEAYDIDKLRVDIQRHDAAVGD